MAKCCSSTSKCFIMLVNLFMWVVAAGLIFLGSWLFTEYARYGELIDIHDAHVLPACLLLFSGLTLFLLGLVGCMGVLKEHKCLIGMYLSLLLVVLVGIIGGAAFAFFYHQRIEDGLHQTMIEGFEKYNSSKTTRDIVDLMQSNVHCCGVNNYTDWEKWFHEETSNLTGTVPAPLSCCSHKNCSLPLVPSDVYHQGCYEKIQAQVVKYTYAIYGVIGGCALIIFIGLCSACMLMRARRNQGFIYRDLSDDDGMRV